MTTTNKPISQEHRTRIERKNAIMALASQWAHSRETNSSGWSVGDIYEIIEWNPPTQAQADAAISGECMFCGERIKHHFPDAHLWGFCDEDCRDSLDEAKKEDRLAARRMKRRALIEAAANTAAGFVIAVIAWHLLTAPLAASWVAAAPGRALSDISVAIATTTFYTLLSLGRNYACRLFFARLHARQKQ